eukprot:TRINITY_DN5083_c0_g2_i7.p1 TRINITY_DN5083_c0_g2~~TRINITY_DN5083_c0_g2_i7.p1  ORF type:complete len:820 (+),score=264.02 TRINITY_DN5083_c0_g2_i7:423-2882(+)
MIKDDYYITMRGSAGLKLEKADQGKGINMASLSKCYLMDPSNLNSAASNFITPQSKVVVKSAFGNFIKIGSDKSVSFHIQAMGDDSVFRVVKAHVPLLPEWLFQRPHLTRDPLLVAQVKPIGVSSLKRRAGVDYPKTLGSAGIETQEQYILQDLLYVMVGIEGTYIKRKDGDSGFAVESKLESPTCDSSLLYLTTKMLPLGTYYDRIQEYIRKRTHYEYGYICHSVCGSLQVIIKEYLLLLTQIDTLFTQGGLTLQKLWFFLQPSIRLFSGLSTMLESIASYRGGNLLTMLYKQAIATSEPNLKKMLLFVIEKGLEQYVKILAQWIYEGTVEDPFEEFMIKENQEYGKESIEKDLTDNYWKYRFVIREDMVPCFFADFAEKILITGKYLHVIRECRRTIDRPFDKGLLRFKLSDPAFIENPGEYKEFIELINEAHEWSCKRILKLIFEEERLAEMLVSIKKYFFMEVGDLFSNFLESSQELLENPVKKILPEKLESIFEMAVRISSASNDPYKEDLTCELSSFSLSDQMFAFLNVKGAITSGVKSLQGAKPAPSSTSNLMGIEAFCLDFKVKWPLNIILSRRALTKYTLIFRRLFFCKSVEMQLENLWKLHQTTKELPLQSYFMETYLLRNRMLHFCKNFLYYVMADVLEPKWHKFKAKLPSMKSLDEVLTLHNQFLDECLKECLLSDSQILNLLTKTFKSFSYYFTVIKRFMNFIQVEEDAFEPLVEMTEEVLGSTVLSGRKEKKQREAEEIKKMITEKNYHKVIAKFTTTFNENVKEFLTYLQKAAQNETYLMNLYTRLDYNQYYSSAFEISIYGFH